MTDSEVAWACKNVVIVGSSITYHDPNYRSRLWTNSRLRIWITDPDYETNRNNFGYDRLKMDKFTTFLLGKFFTQPQSRTFVVVYCFGSGVCGTRHWPDMLRLGINLSQVGFILSGNPTSFLLNIRKNWTRRKKSLWISEYIKKKIPLAIREIFNISVQCIKWSLYRVTSYTWPFLISYKKWLVQCPLYVCNVYVHWTNHFLQNNRKHVHVSLFGLYVNITHGNSSHIDSSWIWFARMRFWFARSFSLKLM